MTVEDGTGLADANSYLSVAEADAYWAERANANWAAATTVAKEAALVNASMYVDLRWGTSISGTPVSAHQVLVFPRNGLPACARGQTLPLRLKWAVAEYASLALTGPLAPTPDASARTKYRVKVGPIEEETTYATEVGTGSIGMWRTYPFADSLMACLSAANTVGANQGRQMRA